MRSFLAAAVAATVLLAACSESATAPGLHPLTQPATRLSALSCAANVAARTVSCTDPATSIAPGSAGIIVGGQHSYVDVTSSNVSYDGSQGFGFDVTVKNLIPQALATTDGATGDSTGVMIFFVSDPTRSGGSGSVSIANADGAATFTNTNQAYFRYAGTDLGADGLLSPNETSAAKHWTLNVDPTVTTFSFTLYVNAQVRYPNGWVDLGGATGYMLSSGTQALVATPRSAVGNALGTPVTWQSSNPSAATVDASGNVIGVAAGRTTITATSGTLTSATTIDVCPDLAVGGVYVASFPAAASTCFGGGALSQEFTYMPVNLSTSSSLSLSVTGSGIQAVTGPPTPIMAWDNAPAESALKLWTENPYARGFVVGGDAAPPLEVVEPGLTGNFPSLATARKARADRMRGQGNGMSVITPNVVPSVGDTMRLDVSQSCNGTSDMRTGTVRKVSQHLIIVGDTANPAGGFTTAQYDSIALEFDTLAWKVDSTNFGPPTDIDGNGHVVAFFTRAVNELSPPASGQVTLGYFHSKDVYARDPASGCGTSNEGEMFYMLVPDPTGAVNSNVRTVSYVRGNTTGTLAHEFQHLINAWRKAYLVPGVTAFEEGWLNEGLSHIAEELMFYQASGMSPRVNIKSGTDATSGIQLNARRVAAYNTYQSQNFTRFRGFLQRPDTAGAFTTHQNSLAVRGVIWSFLRYAVDRKNTGDAALLYSLVNTPLTGKSNLQSVFGADPNAWLRDFTAAVYADDNTFAVSPEYMNPSWNFRSMYTILYGSYQVGPRALTNNVATTLSQAFGGGTAYYRFGVPASGFATVTSYGAGNTIPTSPFSLVVVRTK